MEFFYEIKKRIFLSYILSRFFLHAEAKLERCMIDPRRGFSGARLGKEDKETKNPLYYTHLVTLSV